MASQSTDSGFQDDDPTPIQNGDGPDISGYMYARKYSTTDHTLPQQWAMDHNLSQQWTTDHNITQQQIATSVNNPEEKQPIRFEETKNNWMEMAGYARPSAYVRKLSADMHGGEVIIILISL